MRTKPIAVASHRTPEQSAPRTVHLDSCGLNFGYSFSGEEQMTNDTDPAHAFPKPTTWHHAPPHLFVPNCPYLITVGTLHKVHYFATQQRREMLQRVILDTFEEYGWQVEAWAVMSNHYHVVGVSPTDVERTSMMFRKIHGNSAPSANELDVTPGRRVWFQDWDTCLNSERERLSRFNYVVHNAVHHGLVNDARDYPTCSAPAWYAHTDPSMLTRVTAHQCRPGEVYDDF